MKKIRIVLLIILCLLVVGCTNPFVESNEETSVSTFSGDTLRVNYIDVGQGDSIFIQLPNNETMLIDAGEAYMSKNVINYLNNLGITKIDYVVGTHPHTDHIGGLEEVINTFDIGSIYMPNAISTSKTYEDLLTTISNKGLKVKTAKSGVVVLSEDNLKLEFIAPNSDDYSNLNNYSAVLKLTYLDNTFLFMGDAETLSEDEITSDVNADVIKVGHHGSDSSSGIEFVKKVSPEYAIIMVGEGNSYNHPYQSIIDRYESVGAKVLRTDLDGNIICDSDGASVSCSGDKDFSSDSNSSTTTSNISLVSLDSPVSRGSDVTVSVKGLPNTTYDIDVIYSSGASKASGLEDKTSDSEGNVSWTFKVSSNVKPGTYEVKITDGEDSVSYSLEVTD